MSLVIIYVINSLDNGSSFTVLESYQYQMSPPFICSCMLSKGRFTRIEKKTVGTSLVLVLAGHLLPYDKEKLDHCSCLLYPIEIKIVKERNKTSVKLYSGNYSPYSCLDRKIS